MTQKTRIVANKIFIDTELGEIVFRKNVNAKKYIIRIQNGKVKVTIPKYGNFSFAKDFLSENKQKLLQKIELQTANPVPDIDEIALRKQAQSVLPAELTKLAEQHEFNYSKVTIRKSRSRWGSCTSKKSISLSFYLMLLPGHLIEYVLLHELCHTVHLNHSPAFWELLNNCTGNKAKEFRKEIREYRFRK